MEMNNETKKTIRYADLFGGVGGFRLGIERSAPNSLHKTTCVFYCDNDKYAVQTYNKNFKENWEATDIRKIKASEIPEIDMLCGGFPCQAFSIAGKRRGFQDTRGTLFFEIARIIKAKRPKIIFLENVKGLLNHEKGKTFSIIIKTLWELGYDVQWMVLNSKFFGVPQNRERVFIIGSLRGECRPEILPFRETNGEFNKRNSEKQIASSLQHPGHSGGNYKGMNMVQVHNMQPRSPDRPSLKYSSGGSGHLQRDDTSYCLDGGNTNAVEFNNKKIRRLTPTECERLQGFPDSWTEGVSDTQRYKQMGNAVTVNVIQAIAERLLK